MKLSLIVALGEHGAIGNNGDIPWKCPTDMRHFREKTMDKYVVMGRKTWDSLPPNKLPGRKCLVITSTPLKEESAITFGSFEDAKAFTVNQGAPELVIIGGSRLFMEHYNQCDELNITYIKQPVPEADTHVSFKLVPCIWRVIESKDHPDCTIQRYVKR